MQVIEPPKVAAVDASGSKVGNARPAVIDANAPMCKPTYPEQAVAAKAEGQTIVQLTVNGRGIVTAASIPHHSGTTPEHHLLDSAAIHSLVKCPFRPGLDELGNALGTTVVVTYRWHLD